eukprot:scaffold104211_cov69-Phaeocystis_antarctica.AAC.2
MTRAGPWLGLCACVGQGTIAKGSRRKTLSLPGIVTLFQQHRSRGLRHRKSKTKTPAAHPRTEYGTCTVHAHLAPLRRTPARAARELRRPGLLQLYPDGTHASLSPG